MKRKWMPVTAGVLDIINGGSALFWGFVFSWAGQGAFSGGDLDQESTVKGIVLAVIGVVVVFCSVFAIKRRVWIIALIGSIVGLAGAYPWIEAYWIDFDPDNVFNISLLFNVSAVTAIAALVFTILSREQFRGPHST